MNHPNQRGAVVGRVARVELCPCSRSVVLTIGAMSLRLEFAAADDIATTLTRALTLFAGEPPRVRTAEAPLGTGGAADGSGEDPN